ncbi:MAG TPA: hypothetical protein VKY92_12310 [Verrucomicrobiae bacterium]|nr:hypothetical protein [Verrucomicrobiae bacterium]
MPVAKCNYCDSSIVFGGRSDPTGRYCNAKCQQSGHLVAIAKEVPAQEIERLLEEVRHGTCPRCGGPGPLDVHKSYQVWSALVVTSWRSNLALSCKSCATKRQVGALALSFFVGWWGVPWGLLMTPIQIGRNLGGIFGGPDPSTPSATLRKFVLLHAGANRAKSQSTFKTTAPPPLPPSLGRGIPSLGHMPRA